MATDSDKDRAATERQDLPPVDADSVEYAPGSFVFAVLLAGGVATVLALGALLWYVQTVGLANINPTLASLFGAAFAAAALFVLTGAIVIGYAALKGREDFLSWRFRWLLVKFLLPITVMAGRLSAVKVIRLERAFIEINNRMVRSMIKYKHGFAPRRLLMLMPHCIQWDDCNRKVTRDVKNCIGCKRCEVGELVNISDEYKVALFIATGGTVARRKVAEVRPDAVVVVACERDLTSGIQDAYPLPVLAIVNRRPHGYCMNAGVAIEEVSSAVRMLIKASTPVSPV